MSDGETRVSGMGLLEATSVGVGAIVGGGILALTGLAFATSGPSAILAFALNGILAFLTAASFAELSAMFPQSGGTYTYAKKVLSVEAAFAIGWVVWFASITAGVLYSVGFGYFMAAATAEFWRTVSGEPPAWLTARPAVVVLAVLAIAFYTSRLARKSGGGAAHWENFGKLVVFAVLIVGGVFALRSHSMESVGTSLTPFFYGGALGLFQAMGFTFIAMQGFDLIAAAGGEIRDPTRTIPRAMFLSLGIALATYLPLLFTIAVAGIEPGQSIASASRSNPEEIVAIAAKRFLGPLGYWLVLVAAVLSMLSALRANLFAASRIALAMARDRTMPYLLAKTDRARDTPVAAILATASIIAVVVVVLADVGAAGAASSLIFLVTFAAAHWIAILARRRRGGPGPFRMPWFPLVPTLGIATCLMLAAYQGVMVPSAGLVAGIWLCVGGILFVGLLGRPARVVDASTEAQDPEVSRLRGHSPLILVPVINPTNAEPMIAVANALSPPEVGRVLLLSVAVLPNDWKAGDDILAVRHAQAVLGETLIASARVGLFPEALATLAFNPWKEISRIAAEHRCESLLLGLTTLEGDVSKSPLNRILSTASCEVVVLRAPLGWQLSAVRNILVPVGGRGWHDRLRARLLGSLFRTGDRHVTFLRVVPENAPAQTCTRARRDLARVARDEAPGRSRVKVVTCNEATQVIVNHAAESDLVILGVERTSRYKKGFGQMTLRIARESSSPILIISHRG